MNILKSLFFLFPLATFAQLVEFKAEVKDTVLTPVRLILNWVPEPEFGGFYAADVLGIYEKNGLKVEIISGGAGTPTVQMLAAGKIEFAVTSGSEIIVARSRKSDVVAVYSVFETSPMGIMVHKARKLSGIADLFEKGGTLALQKGQAYVDYLQSKFGTGKVQIVPYSGGVAGFLKDPNFSQQGFIFSEPISAKRSGADPDFFLLSSVGYNPYTEVMAVTGDFLKAHPKIVEAMVKSVAEGWKAYLENPEPANKAMANLNKAMDAQTFLEATSVQKPLVGNGSMTEARWKEHIDQLKEAKTITKIVDPKSVFANIP